MTRISPRLPLYFILATEFCFLAYLALSGKIPNGHDGFQYFSLQYYFLNNLIQSGEIAQWMPYMTHGTVANWWYYIQGSPLQAIWMLAGGLLEPINFIYIFYLNIYVDLVLFTCGIWSLGQLFYKTSEARFLVMAISTISILWFDQIWWNLHLFYLIPLTLFCFLKFCDTQKGIYLFLTGNLSTLQLFGTLPYFSPVISLVLFVFIVSYFCFFKEKWVSFFRGIIKNKWWLLATVGALSVPLCCEILIIENGTREVVKYNPGRNPDGTVSLEGFLGYASVGIFRWHEVFSGFSPRLDFNLYFGVFPLALLLIFVMFKPHRPAAHLWFVIFVLVLFAEGTFVSKFFYYLWPKMKYFRHLILISPVVKMFVLLVVGYAVDRLILINEPIEKKRALLLSSVLMAVIVCSFVVYKFPVIWQAILKKTGGTLPIETALLELNVISAEFLKNLIVCIGVWLGCYLFYIWESRSDLKKCLVWVGIILTLFDLYIYKLRHVEYRMHTLDESQYQQLKFEKAPFLIRRSHGFVETERFKAYPRFVDPDSVNLRAQYWSLNTFLHQDFLATPLRVEHWLGSVEMLIRTTQGFSNMDLKLRPPYFEEGLFAFSEDMPQMLDITGVLSDKIRLAPETDRACSPEEAFQEIRKSGPDAMVILGMRGSESRKGSCEDWKMESQDILSSGSKMQLETIGSRSIEISGFSANSLGLKLNVPSSDSDFMWLYYADAWHPFWKAYVDGKEVPVFQANLAYKAIPVKNGSHDVEFRFGSILNDVAAYLLSLNWLLLLLGVIIFFKSGCKWGGLYRRGNLV